MLQRLFTVLDFLWPFTPTVKAPSKPKFYVKAFQVEKPELSEPFDLPLKVRPNGFVTLQLAYLPRLDGIVQIVSRDEHDRFDVIPLTSNLEGTLTFPVCWLPQRCKELWVDYTPARKRNYGSA